MHALMIYTTTSSREEAERLAEILVTNREAACVQITGPMTSVYQWQGKVEKSTEFTLNIKTHATLFDAVARTIEREHSYEVPEIVAVPIAHGSVNYLVWLGEQVESE